MALKKVMKADLIPNTVVSSSLSVGSDSSSWSEFSLS